MPTPTSTPLPLSPGSVSKLTGGRHRVISSCLTCRRRKVRCDHVHPICGACARGNHVCRYGSDAGSKSAGESDGNRVSKHSLGSSGKGRGGGDVQSRLERLERLLEKASTVQSLPSGRREISEGDEMDSQRSVSTSQNSPPGLSSDNQNGTLLLDGKQTQFVSSLHYALLADEIQDIKALLTDPEEEETQSTTQNHLIHLLSLGRGRVCHNMRQLLPSSQHHRDTLLDIFFNNVDPMVHITHIPTLVRKFPSYMENVHPMCFAVFYSAVNALPPTFVQNKFGEKKEDMLARFELGVEIGLAKENYLTTPDLEVFQAFVLWLTCITKEEDMGKAWALLGVAIRIALHQGLHRDPSLFPAGSWDAVTIEMRRRTWHQVCHLEFRAAECKGQEPSISEDDYTTLLPRNIEDEDLVEGNSPGPSPYDAQKFTTGTFQIVRFMGMCALRRIIKSTYRLERRMMESGLHGTSGPDPAQELRDIFEQIKTMVNDMHEEKYRKYLKFCNPEIGIQRLALGLSSLMEWRCYLLFWLRMPRAYRDVVFSSEIRRSIFEKSVNCIETLNNTTVDAYAVRFIWHIGSHSSFQAIMHILSELRNPLFDAPNRQRALRALQLSRLLKETNKSKSWQAVKSMIDKVVGDSIISGSDSTELVTNPRPATGFKHSQASQPPPPALPLALPPIRTTPQVFTQSYGPNLFTAPASALPSRQMQQEQDRDTRGVGVAPLQQSQVEPEPETQPQFNWNEMNLNNIFGSTVAGFGSETPAEFDFGFWGDPVTFNFGTEPLGAFPFPGSGEGGSGIYEPWVGFGTR